MLTFLKIPKLLSKLDLQELFFPFVNARTRKTGKIVCISKSKDLENQYLIYWLFPFYWFHLFVSQKENLEIRLVANCCY